SKSSRERRTLSESPRLWGGPLNSPFPLVGEGWGGGAALARLDAAIRASMRAIWNASWLAIDCSRPPETRRNAWCARARLDSTARTCAAIGLEASVADARIEPD